MCSPRTSRPRCRCGGRASAIAPLLPPARYHLNWRVGWLRLTLPNGGAVALPADHLVDVDAWSEPSAMCRKYIRNISR